MSKSIPFRRTILIALTCFCLTVAQLPLRGQETQTRPPQTVPAVPLSSLARGRTMAVALKTGKLPEPLRKPQGSNDEVAALLAKKVSARDEQSLPALLAAILNAGFAVRDQDGSVTQTIDPGQGLLFNAWEVAAMAKNYGEGKSTTLKYLTDGFKSIPGWQSAPLDKILLEGIRKHTRGDQPLLRFWSRFIVELGRNADQPYDMLTENNPENIRVDAVQAGLIMHRLSGDLFGFAQRKQQASAQPDRVLKQSHHARSSRTHAPNFSDSVQNRPCKALGEGDGSAILDAGASTITTGWDQLLDYLGKETVGKLLAAVNILLAYAKFIATYAFLETEITVKDPPLIRTYNARPGGYLELSAKVTMNTGSNENINCFRTALNVALGVDASLLSDGPLENVGVVWHLIQGGDSDFYSNRGGVTGTHQIVGFSNRGPRIQDAGTYAGIPGQGGTPVGNATRTTTDKGGVARVSLEGSPHVPYIPEPRLPVMKKAVVLTTVKLKGGDVKGDAVDLYGQLLGGVAGLITMPLELLYRTDWASTASADVPVKDWEPCTEQWQGSITFSTTLREKGDAENAVNKSSWDDEETYEATAILTSQTNNEGSQLANVTATATKITRRYGSGKGVCYRESSQVQELRGSDAVVTSGFSVTVDPRSGRYTVSPPLPVVEGSGTYVVTSEVKGSCNNPYNKALSPKPSPVTGIKLAADGPPLDGTGYIDPKNPNTISGTATEKFPTRRGGERITTMTWTLRRCP